MYDYYSFVKELNISHLISLFYYKSPRNFLFEGESHDFWEFIYIDNRVGDRPLVGRSTSHTTYPAKCGIPTSCNKPTYKAFLHKNGGIIFTSLTHITV